MAKKTEFSAERRTELRRQVLAEIEKTDPAKKKFFIKKAESISLPKAEKPVVSKPKIIKKTIKKIKALPVKVVKTLPVRPKLSLPPLNHELIRQTKTKLKRSPVLTVVSALAVLTVLFLAIDILGIYRFGWQDIFSRQVANIIPLPAGTINGRMIRLSDYLSDIKILNLALANNREGVDGIVSGANMEDRIFNRLALNALMAQKLKDYKQSLTQQEITQAWSDLAGADGEKQIKESIENIYGLSVSQFKEKILKPLLMKEKLQAIITRDQSLKINQDAKKKAEEVLTLALAPGVDFSVLAGQYTQDEAGINTGGDLGWISRGEISPEMETVLFSLASGKVFDRIIENKTGYHIMKAETRLTDNDTGKESVRARQILIKVDINQYLKEILAQAELKKFVK